MTGDQADRFAEWCAERDWTFAKSYADSAPHEYVVIHDLPEEDRDVFDTFVAYIRTHGYEQEFGGRPFTYLDLDGYKYWTMGNPIPETTVLNRKPIDGYGHEYAGGQQQLPGT